MAKYLAVVTDDRHVDYEIERKILEQADAELKVCNCMTASEVREACEEADAVLLNMAPMDGETVKALKRCKVINRYGVGYDNVDVAACTEKGIQVTYVPDYCMEDVSDHALALLMTCLRQTAMRDRQIRNGKWNIQSSVSVRLKGKILGIIGAGRIARALARKVSGFGFSHILAYDPYVDAAVLQELGIEKVELDELCRRADFISLHMPVTDETRGMIDAEKLSLMKKEAILVNTARGALVNDEDLIKALKEERIAFAGLDTYGIEPLPGDSDYFKLDNVVLTDHTAYNTKEGVEELKRKSAENVAAVLSGKEPAYKVNTL